MLFRIILILITLCHCRAAAHQAPWPTDEWPRSAPEAEQLDSSQLNELVRLIREGKRFPDLHGLLVVRNGYLVLEEYFDGHAAHGLHTQQSVSKSFTSALIGIAIEQGKMRGVDEKVLGFFPEMQRIENRDQRKEAMTLGDLLTMRSGTDYHEGSSNSPHSQLNRLSKGWDRFVLNRPMLRQPGSRFQYDSGGVILMSSLLKSRTGMHADAFADRYLFPQIGIQKKRWFKNSQGHPHTGGGLHLRPQDMAKFGLLYLRGGRWQGKQVVPEEWVRESLKKHVDFPGGKGRSTGYGYLWWVLPPDPQGAGEQDIYAAMGFRAQYIFLVPEHDMLVVVTGGTRNYSDQRRPIDFLYSHILPAVEAR